MQFECPICGRRLRVDERLVGRRVKCPGCNSAVEVAEPPAEYESLDDYVEVAEKPARRSVQAAPTSEAVVCPMCGAQNRVLAHQCRECGESLTTDNLRSHAEVWRDGKLLVAGNRARLPNRCVVTNEPATKKLYQKFSWHPPWIYLLVGCGGLVYVVVALIVRKQAEFEIPIGDRARQRRLWAYVAAWILGLGGLGIIVLAIALPTNNVKPGDDGSMKGLLAGLGLLVALIGPTIGVVVGNLVTPKRITDDYIWLKGVHPDYLDKLPKWPGE